MSYQWRRLTTLTMLRIDRAMKIQYDPKADAMYIYLAEGAVVESEDVRPGVVLDFDCSGRVLGIEMLDVSQRTANPREVAFEMLSS